MTTVLYCRVLLLYCKYYGAVLYFTFHCIYYCTVLYCTVLYCIVLYCIVVGGGNIGSISKPLMGQFLRGTVPRYFWQSGAVACQLRYQEEAARMKLGHVTGCGVVLHQKDVL